MTQDAKREETPPPPTPIAFNTNRAYDRITDTFRERTTEALNTNRVYDRITDTLRIRTTEALQPQVPFRLPTLQPIKLCQGGTQKPGGNPFRVSHLCHYATDTHILIHQSHCTSTRHESITTSEADGGKRSVYIHIYNRITETIQTASAWRAEMPREREERGLARLEHF